MTEIIWEVKENYQKIFKFTPNQLKSFQNLFCCATIRIVNCTLFNSPNPYRNIRYGKKTVQVIKLVVGAPEQSYPERDVGDRKIIAGGELCGSKPAGIEKLFRYARKITITIKSNSS